MNYIGSKNTLLDFINNVICEVAGDISRKIFCDIFAGTGAVGNFFKDKVSKIIANDFETYSFVINRNLIQNKKTIKYSLDKLNSLDGIKGFIFNNYSVSSGRSYFTDYNAKKIDAIRTEIEFINRGDLYFYLLASLLESADKVANTASVYGAFLKNIKETASKEITLKPAIFKETKNDNIVYNKDANALIKEISGDILYLDPPYNARQYGANYHLLNTIAEYKEFKPRGKTGLPEYKKSLYCKKSYIKETLNDLIKNANFEYVFLSYNNEGLISVNEIKDIFERYGDYRLFQRYYKRYKADNKRKYRNTETIEYIHSLHK